MYDNKLYVTMLSEFARVLLTPYDVQKALDELTGRVTAVLDLAGSGVTLARDGRLQFDAVLGTAIAELEGVQERLQAGPCVTAYRTGDVVAVTDLGQHDGQWPDYCRTAARVGISSVAAIPLRVGDHALGALNLYAEGPRDWPEDDLAAAAVMADMATVFLVNATEDARHRLRTGQLQEALDSRVVIEQAKGVLAGRHDIPLGTAFDRIRAHARAHNVNLHQVARSVVALELDP